MKSQSKAAKKRTRARAVAVGTAVSKFRAARGLSIRQLAKKADIAASTLVRIEKPGDAPRSPAVDTLEALAGALECSLCEMLGEEPDSTVHHFYRGPDDWPEAVTAVLEDRGGHVPHVERVFIETTLEQSIRKQTRDPEFWRERLTSFRQQARWEIIEGLLGSSWVVVGMDMDGWFMVDLSSKKGRK